MDIAAAASGMSQFELKENVGIALTKKVMDVEKTEGQQLIQMLKTPVSVPHPTSGRHIDIQA